MRDDAPGFSLSLQSGLQTGSRAPPGRSLLPDGAQATCGGGSAVSIRTASCSYCGWAHNHVCKYDHCSHFQAPLSSHSGTMRKIQLKDAKANLSAVVDQATRGKPSVITRHGKPEAVVLGFADWERLSRVPSFGRLLMSAPVEPKDLPKRNRTSMRDAGL